MSQEPVSTRNNDRLESWKAIARFLHKDVRTVQRWERVEGLPVHRHEHKKQATVYAYTHEIDEWRARRDRPGTSYRRPWRLWVVAVAVVLAIVALIAQTLTNTDTFPSQSESLVIVVTPFEDLSLEPLGLMADGMSDELSSRLASSASDRLAVIARLSAMSLKDNDVPIQTAHRQFGADLVIDGTVRGDAESIRVSSQLVDARTMVSLWAGTFDFPTDDWLHAQQDASTLILNEIHEILGIDIPEDVTLKRYQTSAYEHVLIGRHYFDQFDPKKIHGAMKSFESALETDPDYVDAHEGLALSNAALAFFGLAPAAEAYVAAETWVNSALEFEPSNGVALAVLGWIDYVYRWDIETGARKLRQAVELAPNEPWTHWLLANYLSATGHGDEAVAAIDAAVRIDPVSPFNLVARGYILTNAGRPQEAIEHFAEVNVRLPVGVGEFFLIAAYEASGDYVQAAQLQAAIGHPVGSDLVEAARADSNLNYWQVLAEYYRQSLDRRPDTFSWRAAVAWAKSGENERALEMLELGFAQRDPRMVYLPIYPLESLHDEPRFIAILNEFTVD